jgi:hypothetical protein
MDIDRTNDTIQLSVPEQLMTGLPESIPLEQVFMSAAEILRLQGQSRDQATLYALDADLRQRSLAYGLARKAAKLHGIMDELLYSAEVLSGDDQKI